MASKYDLQLKAILDTTQVKQELQKLRTMQQQMLGGGKGNTFVGSPQNNLANLNGLNSTLEKLNLAINRLNNNIQKLTNEQIKSKLNAPRTSVAGYQPRRLVGGDLPDAGVARSGDTFALGYLEREQKKIKHINENYRKSLKRAEESNASFEVQQRYKAGIRNTNDKIAQFELAKNTIKSDGGKISPQIQQMITMGVGGFLVGDLAAGLTQYLQRTGNKTGETLAMYGSHMGQGVAMGAPLGVPGMLAGGAFGLIQGSFQKLAEAAEEAANELIKLKEEANIYGQLQESYKNIKRQEKYDAEIDRYVKTNNKSTLESMLKQRNAEFELVEKRLGDINPEKLAKRKLQIQEENTKFGVIDSRTDADIAEQLEIDIQLQSYQKNLTRRNELINDRLKIEEALKTLEQKEAEALQKKQQNQDRLAINKLDIANQRLSLSRYDEIIKNGNIISNNDYASIKLNTTSYKQQADDARKQYEKYLSLAENAKTADESDKFLDSANSQYSRWQFANAEFSKFNSALTLLEANQNTDKLNKLQEALSKLTAPSMENVNSLASQGLMINRADDASREKSMIDYEREQTELQKQIKEILDEKSFKSVIA